MHLLKRKSSSSKALALGGSVASLCALFSALLPLPAAAIDFTFTASGGVQGIVRGLAEGFNNQPSPPILVELLNPGGLGIVSGTYLSATGSYLGTTGITVDGGQVVSSNWFGYDQNMTRNVLYLGFPNFVDSSNNCDVTSAGVILLPCPSNGQYAQNLTFTPGSSFDPGTSPSNPVLPPPPANSGDPWVFPPVVVDDPGRIWWFDPEIAIGYIYNVDDLAGPLFDQYIAPDLPFNDDYQLYSSGGASCSVNPEDYTILLGTATQNVVYNFAAPLACFAIRGIDPLNALDPLDSMAFVAGIGFDKAGAVTVSQTPISTAVPGPLGVFGATMAYGWARRLRQRLQESRVS